MLSILFYHGMRSAQLWALRMMDLKDRRGVRHLQVDGKGGKIRYLPMHPAAAGTVAVYLDEAGHGDDKDHCFGLSVTNPRRPALDHPGWRL
jgi:integrase/recombinase XerD